MAFVDPNSALTSISGTIDGFVYRRYRGKIVLQRKAVCTRPRAAGQLQAQTVFKAASEYAARVRAEPALHAYYAARGKRSGKNYRAMAMSDFFHPPRIDRLLLGAYSVTQGGELIVEASDNVDVMRVTVALHSVTGEAFHRAEATLRHGRWHCVVPAPAGETPPPVRLRVTAYDRPGHATTQDFALPGGVPLGAAEA